MKRMMKRVIGTGWMAAALLASACGLPREAGTLARTQAAASAIPASDGEVRTALLQQADAWPALAAMLSQREVGGIMGVDGRFVELVNRARALAARQRALIEQGADDPAANRAVLESFRTLWQQTERCLNP